MLEQLRKKRAADEGFTLIELLIVIVIIGVLAAVVVLAIGGITDKGSAASCTATQDAATAAAATFYAQSSTNQWPATFTAMTTAVPPLLQGQGNVTVNDATIAGKGWTLTIHGGAAVQTTYSGCPA